VAIRQLSQSLRKIVGSHFNADQPGLGKTIEELGALVEAGITGKILIVAPRKALRATWGPQIRRWLYKSKFRVRIVYADSVEGSSDDREGLIADFVKTAKSTKRAELLARQPRDGAI
jgi:hypothetical protein